MDSFRKVLGLGSKSPRPSTTQPPQPTEQVHPVQELSPPHNASEDDIFSDMLINAPVASYKNQSQNISDIQDLDIGFTCTSATEDGDIHVISGTDDGSSAFGFINAEPFQEDGAGEPDGGTLVESSCSATEDETHSDTSSNFSFMTDDASSIPAVAKDEEKASRGSTPTAPRGKNTRKTKRLSTKPGFGNVASDVSKKSPSTEKRTVAETQDQITIESVSTHLKSANETTDSPTVMYVTTTTSTTVTESERTTLASVEPTTILPAPRTVTTATTMTPAATTITLTATTPTPTPTTPTTITTATTTATPTTVPLQTMPTAPIVKSSADTFHCSEEGGQSQHLNASLTVEGSITTNDQDNQLQVEKREVEEEEEEDIFADLSLNSCSKETKLTNANEEVTEHVGDSCEDNAVLLKDKVGTEHHLLEGEHDTAKGDDVRDVCGCTPPQLNVEEGESDRYDVEITGEDKVMLQLQRLQQEEQIYKKEKAEALVEQQKLIDQWIEDHMSEDQIHRKILELRETQSMLEKKEDYDAAADIDQTIVDLNEKCQKYKYQHPLRDERFMYLLRKYEDQCITHNAQYERMLRENEELVAWFRTKTSEEEGEEEKRLKEATLELKENKLKLERELSHTSLDNQHIVKNRSLLQEEIGKETKHLIMEKGELVEKRTVVQVEIEQLKLKLSQLQSEEQNLTSLIVGIENEIGSIEDGFRPRIDQLSMEEEAVRKRDEELKTKLEDMTSEETRIQNRNMDIVNQRTKTAEIIGQITSSMDEMRREMDLNSKELFKYEDVVDFGGLVEDADYAQCKKEYEELQTNITQITNRLVADEAKQKRLRRTLSELEAQLAELDKLKQAHVQERKYKDAKETTEEIKTLRRKGEVLSSEEMQLSDSIKSEQQALKQLKAELEKVEEEYRMKEELHEQGIMENLKVMSAMVDKLHTQQPDGWTSAILGLTLVNNKNIIESLSKKHGLDSIDQDNVNNSSCEEELDNAQEDLLTEIDELERNLKVAEAQEDWEMAEEIDNTIQAKKKLLDTAT